MPYCKDCNYLAASGETECRLCGKELVPAPVAPNAAETVGTAGAVGTVGATVPRPGNPLLKRLAFVGVPLAAILGGAGLAYHYFHSVPTLEEIVPKNAAIVGVADSQWWWNAGADVRAIPQVRDAIKQEEKEAGLSMQDDIASWAGQSGFAITRFDAKHPQAVGYLQVRDWPAFYRFYNKIKQKATADGDLAWTGYTYHGVPIQSLADKKPQVGEPMPKLTVSWIKGWVLVGIGDGAVEQAIDTYQGRTPSLGQDPTWAAVLAHKPAHCFAWGGVSSDALAIALRAQTGDKPQSAGDNATTDDTSAALSNSMAPLLGVLGGGGKMGNYNASNPGAYWDKLSQYKFVTAGFASDTGNGFRFDTYSVAGSDKVKAMWRDIKGTSGGVTGDILTQLPKDSNVAFLAHDPAGWWTRYKKLIVSEMPADARGDLDKTLKEAAPAEAIVANYPGDCGVALAYHPGKGFGAVLLAQGKSPDAVAQSVSDINAYAVKNGIKVSQSAGSISTYAVKNNIKVKPTGDGLYALPELVDNSQPEFPLAPVYGARGDYFAAATSPFWVDSRAEKGAGLTLPEDARGADLVAMGNFALLPAVVKDMTPALYSEMGYTGHDKSGDAAKAALNDTGLETAHWDGFTKIAPDGSTQESTWEITGWDWRAVEKKEIADLQKLLPKS